MSFIPVPPYNMTLEWDPTPPFILNSMVNLTCGAFHSRPPAEIIWLHGVKDLSDLADTYETFYNNSDGLYMYQSNSMFQRTC